MGTPATTSNAPWLVMVYLAGDNNLTEEMVLALQDLAAEGPPERAQRSSRNSTRAVLASRRSGTSSMHPLRPKDWFP